MKISALLLLLGTAGLHAQTWTVEYLHPVGAMSSYLFGVAENQQVGGVEIDGIVHAAIWSGTATSFVDLKPLTSSATSPSLINGTTGTQQAGEASFGGDTHAGIWSGTTDSFIDLNPTTVPATTSSLTSTAGTQQAGCIFVGPDVRAAIWSGSAASYLSLHPAGATRSLITATTGVVQVGYVSYGSLHAALWTGSVGSMVDLNPPGAVSSVLNATTTGTQHAGFATFTGGAHAGLWVGAPFTFIDLHPAGATSSTVHAMTNTEQTGYASIGGLSHAALWTSTADSFVDLHSFLVTDYNTSVGRAIWSDDSTILVAGYAHNATASRDEAVLWKFTRPPAAAPLLTIKGKKKRTTTSSKIKIRGTASDPDGNLVRVEARVGKAGFKKAKGTAKWTFTTRKLRPGKNKITIQAVDSTNLTSTAVRLIVTRSSAASR